jgi:hypothetical protein
MTLPILDTLQKANKLAGYLADIPRAVPNMDRLRPGTAY